MMERHKTLCNNHNELIFQLKQIKKRRQITSEEINELMDLIRFCKKQGQVMENRMRDYRSAIEGLGFKRC
jgi:uncharacterized coiled-coil DUF342 family protein